MTTAEKRGVDKAKEELNEAKDRIKRLEEALEAVANVIGPPGKSTWVSDDELNRAWELYIKTKEAHP
jgi:archaellum component FlaC